MFKYWDIHFAKTLRKDMGYWYFDLLPCVSFNHDDIFNDEEYFSIDIRWLIWCIHISNTTYKPEKKKGKK
jgi:hypothetical protein